MPQEVHVRARVDLTQDPVEIEGLRIEIEIEALREDNLEDVAREDVLTCRLDGSAVLGLSHRRGDLGDRVGGVRERHQWFVDGSGTVIGELMDLGDRRVVGGLQIGVVVDDDVGEQGDPLSPMVVHGEFSDHRDHRIGVTEIIGGYVGKMLDLAHDVVAEVADQTAVQRR